jgi:PAS domain S-box-containing protein
MANEPDDCERPSARLEAVRRARLLDYPADDDFDRLTRLTSRTLAAPVVLVTVVEDTRQFFTSAVGLREPWRSLRETPISHSFCRIVIETKRPFVVSDARKNPFVCDNSAIRDLGVIAYAGVPIFFEEEAVGVLCAIDEEPRAWSDEDVGHLSDLAHIAGSEIALRVALDRAREQEALHDAILNSLGEGVLAVDQTGTLISANAAARRMLGDVELGQGIPHNQSTRTDLPSSNKSNLVTGHDALWRACRGESTDGLSATVERGDKALTLEVSGRPISGPSGTLLGGVAVFRDVTTTGRLTALFAAVLESVGDSVLAVAADRAFLVVNAAARHMFDVDAIIVSDRPLEWAPTHQAHREDGTALPSDEGALSRALRGESTDNVTFTMRRRGVGEIMWIEATGRPVVNGDGRVIAAVAVYRDVTQRKHEEDRRTQMQDLLLRTGRMAKVGGWELDLETMTPLWSEEVYRIHDVDIGILPDIARAIEFYAPEARPIVEAAVASAIENGDPFDFELPFTTARGRKLWVRAQGERVVQPGRPARLIGTFQDITERKASQELLQASLHQKDVLLMEIHHRVKNNFQIICSLLNLQAGQLADAVAREALGEAQSRIRAISLAHEQLYASKDLAHIDIGDHARVLSETLVRSLGALARNVEIDISATPCLVGIDIAIPSGLIINELMSNALKHAFHGRVGRVRVSIDAHGGHIASLSVEDNGIGLPAGFDAMSATSLGLRLVSALAQQIGGTLRVSNSASGGAKFRIELAPR